MRTTFVFVLLLVLGHAGICQGADTRFMAVAYHGVVVTKAELTADDITVETLVNHFEWLLANGYHPVSIDQLIQARDRGVVLPPRPVLLCWDDGYANFYDHVFPLLRAYRFPAVLALVGNWMQVVQGAKVLYGAKQVKREKFLSWAQIRELASSGLVEIASHSMGLHKGVLADGAGDRLPAVIGHIYNKKSGTYESDKEMFTRILSDLQANNALIEKEAGVKPRVMVWPYGRYNQLALEAADRAGLKITLTLDSTTPRIKQLAAVPRLYPTLNPETGSFRNSLRLKPHHPLRRMVVIENRMLSQDEEEKNFSVLLDRMKNLQPERLILSPVIDEGGEIRALFRNDRFSMQGDRLQRFVWHTDRRGGVPVHLLVGDRLLYPGEKEDWAAVERFFAALGRSAPASGVVLKSSRLVDDLLQVNLKEALGDPAAMQPAIWGPDLRRQRRQVLAEMVSIPASRVIKVLEAYQYYQPYQEIGLLLEGKRLDELTPERAEKLLAIADYLLLDLQERSDESLSVLEQPGFQRLLPALAVLISQGKSGGRALTERLLNLSRFGLSGWGYGKDDFLHNRPDLEIVRPAISARHYPFVAR